MEDAHEAEEVIEVPDEAEEAAAAVPAAASAAQPSMELNVPSGLQVEPVFATQVISPLIPFSTTSRLVQRMVARILSPE